MASVGRDSGLGDSKYSPVTAEGEFTVFYERWRSPVRRGLAMALGDVVLADEAVDEALTRALAHWDKVRDYERPDGWLYRVGLNWARGTFRKRRYELLSDLEPDSHSSHDPLPDPDLLEAVGHLSVRLRSVVVARYYLDLSTSEVAEALEVPEGTVKSRLSRALNRLARELGDPS
jgi:RNA polymerase sigma-70 factor (ECF subfamily)